MPEVPRNEVAGASRCSAHRCVGCTDRDISDIATVSKSRHAACVRANEVALHGVRGCAGTVEINAIGWVAGDDISCSWCGAANDVVAATSNSHTRTDIAQGGGSGDISSNKVALDYVGIAADDKNTVSVGGNNIARGCRRTANGVVIGAPGDIYPAATAGAAASGPAGICAEKVALRDVSRPAPAIEADAIAVIAGTHV